MSRVNLLPRLGVSRWGSTDLDCDRDVTGYSLAFQWGPIFLEFCWGRRA